MARGDNTSGLGFDWLQYAPPGYMAVGSIAFQLLGELALPILRVLSLVAGLLTIVLVERLGRSLTHAQSGLIVSAWVAMAPIFIEYQTLAKPYALDLLLAVALVGALAQRRRVLVLALVTVGPLFSFGFGFFALASIPVALAGSRRWPSRFQLLVIAVALVSTLASYFAGDSISRSAIQDGNAGSFRASLGQLIYGWPILDSGLFPFAHLLVPISGGTVVLAILGVSIYVVLLVSPLSIGKQYLILAGAALVAFGGIAGIALTTRAYLPVFACLIAWLVLGYKELVDGARMVWRVAATAFFVGSLATSALLTSQASRLYPDTSLIVDRIVTSEGRLYTDAGLGPVVQWLGITQALGPAVSADLLVLTDDSLSSCRGATLSAGDLLIVPISSIERTGTPKGLWTEYKSGGVALLRATRASKLPVAEAPSLCASPLRNPARSWDRTVVMP